MRASAPPAARTAGPTIGMSSDVIVLDWPRPHYEPSPQASRTLLPRRRRAARRLDAPVVGPVTTSTGIEDVIQISKHRRSDDPAWFDAWFSRHRSVRRTSAGASRGLRSRRGRTSSPSSAVAFPDQPRSAYLRNTDRRRLGRRRGGASRSSTSTPSRGGGRRVAAAVRGPQRVPHRRPHLHPRHRRAAATARGLWTHTRGMRKFGRPDLHDPPPARRRTTLATPPSATAASLLNGIANYLAGGAVVRRRPDDAPAVLRRDRRVPRRRTIPDDAEAFRRAVARGLRDRPGRRAYRSPAIRSDAAADRWRELTFQRKSRTALYREFVDESPKDFTLEM